MNGGRGQNRGGFCERGHDKEVVVNLAVNENLRAMFNVIIAINLVIRNLIVGADKRAMKRVQILQKI